MKRFRHCEFVRGGARRDCWQHTVSRDEWCIPCLARAIEYPNDARRAAGRLLTKSPKAAAEAARPSTPHKGADQSSAAPSCRFFS